MPDPLDALYLPRERTDPGLAATRRVLRQIDVDLRALRAPAARPLEVVMTTTVTDYDVLDDALAVLDGTGPEFDPFGTGLCLSNHASMLAEALCAMGRPDAVMPRVEHYRRYLTAAPRPRLPITAWRSALGDLDRYPDWVQLFEAELSSSPWADVVDRWVPRLAAATVAVHGVVRTAHAVRGLAQGETPLRLRELAESLGYWAAIYETMPETHGERGGLLPSAALPLVEQIDRDDRTNWMLFTEPLGKVAAMPSFAGVPDLVAVDGDPSVFLSDLTAVLAAMLVTNASVGRTARGIVHALTAGAATRMMLPQLSPESTVIALRYGWQAAAAFYAGLAAEPPARNIEAFDGTIDDLVDEAIACPDEHGIKITEACLREYRITPDPVYLAAARECTRSLALRGLRLP